MQSPNLADENTLNVLPHLLLHRSDTVLPKTAKPSTEQSAPKRAKFLTLKLEPNSTIPKTEKEEPQRMNERRLVDDANSTAWYTDKLMKELNLHAP
jgi:hypothetical protein